MYIAKNLKIGTSEVPNLESEQMNVNQKKYSPSISQCNRLKIEKYSLINISVYVAKNLKIGIWKVPKLESEQMVMNLEIESKRI